MPTDREPLDDRLRKCAEDPMWDAHAEVPKAWLVETIGFLDAIREWRNAREAFFALPPLTANPKDRIPPEIMTRLGNAEHRLMTLAREQLTTGPAADISPPPGSRRATPR